LREVKGIILHVFLATMLVVPGAFSSTGCSCGEESYGELRRRMVEGQIIARGITDSLVVESMLRVPRHLFVPGDLRNLAYMDSPLPIGEGQTISQPFIVALMTSLLELKDGGRVLEIGTGSGYQAAVLSLIADSVFTIEIIPQLAERAAGLLDSLGFANISVKVGDGYYGWPEKAPFDAVIVTAAPLQVPEPLVEQLKEGGILVIPVGEDYQLLKKFRKLSGSLKLEATFPVRFVPMTGKARRER